MKAFIQARTAQKLSQRKLALLSSVSYKTVQLMEDDADARVSTWIQVSRGLGYGPRALQKHLENFFENAPHSIFATSERMLSEKKADWTIALFDFVDAFRKQPTSDLIEHPPVANLSVTLKSLLASVVETLCDEKQLPYPNWVYATFALSSPWFVGETENLKAMALVESPVHFRKRNIFVLENFLSRA